MCCSAKDAGVRALEQLVRRRGQFDYLLLETTGLADPAPLARMFWLDDALGSCIRLDGIVCVVDARHCLRCLDDNAARQIAVADRVIVNKADLVAPDELAALCSLVRRMNGLAELRSTTYAAVPLDFLLGLQAFNVSRVRVMEDAVDAPTAVLPPTVRPLAMAGIDTVTLRVPDVAFERAGLRAWLQELLWKTAAETGTSVIRLKGVAHVADSERRAVVQAVYQQFEIVLTTAWGAEEPRVTTLVLVGCGMRAEVLRASLRRHAVGHTAAS